VGLGSHIEILKLYLCGGSGDELGEMGLVKKKENCCGGPPRTNI